MEMHVFSNGLVRDFAYLTGVNVHLLQIQMCFETNHTAQSEITRFIKLHHIGTFSEWKLYILNTRTRARARPRVCV